MDKKVNFLKDYQNIVKYTDSNNISSTQWTEIGDTFEQLSIYKENTPVETSNSSIIQND